MDTKKIILLALGAYLVYKMMQKEKENGASVSTDQPTDDTKIDAKLVESSPTYKTVTNNTGNTGKDKSSSVISIEGYKKDYRLGML